LVRGKTGTLSHPFGISSLAGYCKGADGHLLAFAIMDNDMSVLDARVLQKKLCLAMTDINHSKEQQRKTK
jgi:D-alanyl-D-alanine carboxypeptidase/D-alanyl-D-alanine-endopeptidase (penicillin-binding protein 4)